MFHRCLPAGCALFLTFGTAGAALAAPYYFTALSPVGSYTTTIPYAVNTVNGQFEVVGKTGGSYAATRGGYPAVWSGPAVAGAAAGTNILSDISGASAGDRVSGIDGNGDLAGYTHNSTSSYSFFLPSGSSTATVLPVLNSGDMTYAYGLNNSQQVVGLSGSNSEAGQAVIWTQSSGTWGVAALPNLPGAASSSLGDGPSQASAVSSNGVVAGWSNVLRGSIQEQDAVTWTNTGSGWVAADLSLSSRTQYSNTAVAFAATAVNSAGTAVGWGYLGGEEPTGTAPLNAVEFSGGKTILLGGLGADYPYNSALPNDSALGINQNGVIVGYAVTSAGATDAFIYGLGGNDAMQDMNTAFAGSIPKGWSLTAATAIDNNGDIVGYGSDGTPGTQGFLFSPALPGDANLDGRVDVNDLTVVLTNFGTSGATWATGDFVGDGKVDVNDLTIVLANFGRTFGAASGGNVSAVPEPSTLALVAAIGLLGFVWRRLARPERA